MRAIDSTKAAPGSPQSSRFSFFKSFSYKRAALTCVLLATGLLLPAAASADPPAHGRLAALDVAGLNHACGTAIDNKGDLYASSAEDNEIKVFDAEHNELTSIEDTEEPCALAVQTDGTLYVSERETGEVVRYEPSEYPPTESVVYGPSEVIDASGVAKGIAVDRADSRLYVAEGDRVSLYDAEGNLAAVNELQKVRVANATGGTFTLSFEGSEPTPSIPYNATPEELRAALEEIPALEGDVSVAKPAVAYLITFTGALGGKDVPLLEANASGLTGSGSQKVVVEEGTKGFSGHLGEGSLGEATGVAAYTYTDAAESADRRLYLAVADAEGDVIKLFSGLTAASAMRLRRTISGVDQDRDPETPDQQFEFGAAGAYLSADPGNEGPAPARKCTQVEVSGQKQACTAGHLFLYDAGHGVVDELDAHGDFLDQLTAAGLADAGPTQVAVQRTGEGGDGTVYVSSGASAGAKLYAFGPLPLPGRELDEARSHVLEKAAAVAVDPYGYLYVAAQTKVHVYSPAGAPVVEFETTGKAGDLALDSKCRVYEVESGAPAFTYYSPSQCPPTPATTFARHEPNLVPAGAITGVGLEAVAVDPANDHAFLAISGIGQPGIVEFGSAEEGSPILDECSAGLGSGPIDIDVNAATGEIYHPGVFGHIYASTCGAEPELLRDIKGGGCPSGEILVNAAIAIDQSDGHLLVYANIGLEGETAREYEGTGGCVAEFGSFKPTSGGYRVAIDNSCALHDPPLVGAACESFDPAYGTAYVAFDSTNKAQTYDVSAFKPLDYGTPPTPEEFNLTVKVEGEGTVTGPGISCPGDCEEEYEAGEEVTLTATPDEGSEFSGWSGCDSEPEGNCLVSMSMAKEVTATFEPEEEVDPDPVLSVAIEEGQGTVESSPAGVLCSPLCSASFPEGTEVTLTASPEAGYLFKSWKGCDKGSVEGRRCTVTLSSLGELREVGAKFVASYDVTLQNNGGGKVYSKPGGALCLPSCTAATASFKEGKPVEVLTKPDKHFHLVEFGGDCSGTTCEGLEANSTVSASFAEDAKATLELGKEGGGQGLLKSKPAGLNCTYTCSGQEVSFYEGEVLTISWKLGKGTSSIEWTTGAGSCTGTSEATEGNCQVTMDEAHGLEASFE